MIYRKLSKRQLLAMTWWNRPKLSSYDALICDGSVRSGKTLAMSVGFLLWSMQTFNGQTFAICGKTIQSLRRNVIQSLPQWVSGIFQIREKRNENMLIVSDGAGRENTYFLFGGKDESSYTLIQGITLAGVLLDEVALMPRSFVEQACARCSVSGSKFWFNCNPEGPSHWFYVEWILGQREHNAFRLHFTMDDNHSLAPEIKARYERLYSGVFYDRYIRGLWVLAEGLIYSDFDADKHTTDLVPVQGRWFISVDYGTINPFSAGLWCVADGKAVRVKEYYFDSRKEHRQQTDAEYYDQLVKLADGKVIESVVVDPSAASFIELIRRHGRFSVRKARNDVLRGIRLTARLLQSGKLLIGSSCVDCIREFGLYVWDEKADTDRPLKTNDHAMDDVRYFCETILRDLERGGQLEEEG